MKRSSEVLLKAVLNLPAEEREELAARLLGSVGDAEEAALGPEWKAEIEKRLKEIDDGSVEAIDGDEFMAWLDAQCEPEKPKR
ncbi:MAG TPA: addiction module protein [Tepidisphaeraceae bacterium]|nr:addiction module protein [Tepidisphaeraceae bacterium]